MAICPFCEHVHPTALHPLSCRRATGGRSSRGRRPGHVVGKRFRSTSRGGGARPTSSGTAATEPPFAPVFRPCRTKQSPPATARDTAIRLRRRVIRAALQRPSNARLCPLSTRHLGPRRGVGSKSTGLASDMRQPLTGYASRFSCASSRSPPEARLSTHKATHSQPYTSITSSRMRRALLLVRLLRGRPRGRTRDMAVAGRRHRHGPAQSGRTIASGNPPISPRVRGGPIHARSVCLRSRHRPALRQHDRLHGRLGPVLRLAQACACYDAAVVRLHGAPQRCPGEDRRSSSSGSAEQQRRPPDPAHYDDMIAKAFARRAESWPTTAS